MEWFFIEAAVALGIGIAIVWWTMAPQRKLQKELPSKVSTELPSELPPESPTETDAKSKGG